MALIDKASLLMVPSTYEAGTLYNVLPSGNRAPDSTDQNSGYDQTRADFDFDRGSNAAATRVNASGLIEKYRENLVKYSNAFNTGWDKDRILSATSGQSGYDGTNNAWLILADSVNNNHQIRRSDSTLSGVQTNSVYAKYSGYHLQLRATGIGSTNIWVNFDLQNGTIGNSGGGQIDANIESIGNGWYRCSITYNPSSASYIGIVMVQNPATDGSMPSFVGDLTSGIFIQNAQAEKGMVASSYLDSGATTAKAGVLVDLPRINYDANGENGALLLEPSRQQLLQYSEYFDGSGWNKTSGGTGSTPTTTINTNETLSPEGVYNATKIVFDSGSGTTTGDLSLIEGVVSIAAGTDASTSIWLKGENGGEQLHMRGVSNGSFSIITLTNEWQQFTTSENSSTTTDSLQFGIRQNVSGLGIINSTATIYAYGAQIELGSYPTSYIPNHGTSGGVTRAADSCSVTGVSDVIGQTEGTMFAEFTIDSDNTDGYNRIFAVSDNSSNNRIVLFAQNTEKLRAYVANGGVQQANIISSQSVLGSHKIAFAYKANDFALYMDGTQIGTDTSGSIPACSNVYVGTEENAGAGDELRGSVKQAILFKERLSNAELAALTA